GQGGTQGLQAFDKGVGSGITYAVMQIGGKPGGRFILQGFEPGEERGNTDTACDPDLSSAFVNAGNIEAAIRTFHLDRVADAQLVGQSACVVTECLNRKGNSAITAISAGDGEGMSPLGLVKGDKSKLAGMVTAPLSVKA